MTSSVALILLAALAAISTFLLTYLARQYALRRGVLDVPSHRSLHDRPTPRGGGIALAFVVVAFTAMAGLAGWIDHGVALVLAIGGTIIASVGWVDDHRPLAGSVRLAVHGIAAALAVSLLGGLDSLSIGSVQVSMGLTGYVVAWAGVVWLTNLYNFMDGIDGIAGAEAVVVATGGALLLLSAGMESLATVCVVIGGAAAGFLAWNWPPAKIFLGDSGSGLLGYSFAVLGLAANNAGAIDISVWVTLLAVFAIDATFTLLRRLHGRNNAFDAHRSHAYQRMVQSGWSHGRVTSAATALSLVCVAAAAAMVAHPDAAPAVVLVLLVLLTAVYVTVESRTPMERSDQPARDVASR